jgi:hypothetical protein
MGRRGRRALVGAMVILGVAGAPSATAVAEEPVRASGAEVAQPAPAEGDQDAGAEALVPLPDMGLAHRRGDGGMNLFRMPLSELEDGVGVARAVRALPASAGFRADRLKVVAGDFADLTAGDDGTADHVVWLAGSDGGVRVYTVAGGTDTAPRLLRALPKSAGWSWADSRPLAGDVNGDGWDDLVVVHRAGVNTVVWVLKSTGTTLAAPQLWGRAGGDFGTTRNYVADADGDGNEDLLVTAPNSDGTNAFSTYAVLTKPDGSGAVGTTVAGTRFRTASGFSFVNSRQLAGDVDGDGWVDLVTVHRSSNGGVFIWVSSNCSEGSNDVCWAAPTLWQNLSTGGWSFAYSRQYLADTDGDQVDDVVTVHRTGTGGQVVWRHVSDTTRFAAPRKVRDLPASAGWNWSLSRESIADTWGSFGP